ncbi:MAG: hypothetical protein HY899_11080 [Deltaproteobacteria bacterium]|nr:hypothetical protein [Deltaproteobacteria bacterium]
MLVEWRVPRREQMAQVVDPVDRANDVLQFLKMHVDSPANSVPVAAGAAELRWLRRFVGKGNRHAQRANAPVGE